MYDAGKIIAGIVIFVVLVTFPYLIGMGKAYPKPDPKLDTPTINQLKEKKCIEPKQVMKSEHMQMLNNWRDAVVRDGDRLYTASDGKQYAMSLQNTCMRCHSNKKQFCDQCHNYVGVKPYCWDCHIAPKEDQTASMPFRPVVQLSKPSAVHLLFNVSKAALPPDAATPLAPIIDYLKANAAAKAVISGYTDKTGNAANNMELAKNRAKAVRDALTSAGVAEDRIVMKKPEVITGSGSNSDARRVEVGIVGGEGV